MGKLDFHFKRDPFADLAENAGFAPEVSVIMPVYNAAQTVAASIASVLAQSFPHFELIAIDDGSRDASLSAPIDLAAVSSNPLDVYKRRVVLLTRQTFSPPTVPTTGRAREGTNRGRHIGTPVKGPAIGALT